MTPAARLAALLDHLGIGRTHLAAQIAAEAADFVAACPDRIAGIGLCAPSRRDPAPFAPFAGRLLLIAGERGESAEVAARAARLLPAARRHVLAGYQAWTWTDVAAERTAEVAEAMTGFLAEHHAEPPRPPAREGSHAGISWRVEGSGPALLLLPFFLAPSQWAPAVPLLARRFTVVMLGGPHLGGVASLEDRARAPSYRAMFNSLVDCLAPLPGERILEVGCGAGSLVRLLARRLGEDNPITAADLNPFLLREAGLLAEAEGLASRIRFVEGNAERLPIEDALFECVYSVTVLEECDADRAIAEMLRVTRPGGRVAVAVRALDLSQWWNLDLPESVRAKVAMPPQSVGKEGVADRSLYPRMRRAGLEDLVAFPYLVTLDNPAGPIWRNREEHALSRLDPEETALWQEARERAAAQGLLFMAHPLHCAVGRKPARG
ncbi:MAG TPA: methyltransferase domain-containing protein [Stellaceae bacterium]|nr:methyltransferase domain-containing protein [Stellaceae bacterium]